jgi:UDP-glucose 4-epimerase
MSSSAYITGVSGFIGLHTARVFAGENYTVIGIDQRPLDPSDRSKYGISQFVQTSCALESLNKIASEHGRPSVIVHCAGSASVQMSFDDPRADFVSNVMTTADVLEYARANQNVRVVVPSSAAVYGAVSTIPLDEQGAVRPVSPYGVHKLLAEQLCRSYGASFGVRVACVRLFSVFGAGLRKQLLWDACNKADAHNFTFFGTGDEVRDWLHVVDAARLLHLAAEWASPQCPIVNGGTGIGTSIREILLRIGQRWHPPLVPMFSGQERRGDPQQYIADTKLGVRLGFTATINLDDALLEYVEWFRKERGS